MSHGGGRTGGCRFIIGTHTRKRVCSSSFLSLVPTPKTRCSSSARRPAPRPAARPPGPRVGQRQPHASQSSPQRQAATMPHSPPIRRAGRSSWVRPSPRLGRAQPRPWPRVKAVSTMGRAWSGVHAGNGAGPAAGARADGDNPTLSSLDPPNQPHHHHPPHSQPPSPSSTAPPPRPPRTAGTAAMPRSRPSE